MTASPDRRLWIALIVMTGLATVVRIAVVESLEDQSYFTKYIHFANELRAGTMSRDRIPDVSPGYLWSVALMQAAGAGVPAIRAVQIVLLGGVAVLAAWIAQQVAGRLAAVIAAALVLTNKAALINATDIEPEMLLLFFSAVGLALVVTADRRWTPLAAGIAFGIAATMRPVALLPTAVVLVWIALRRKGAALRFGAGVAAPVVAVLVVNFMLTGSALLMDPGVVLYEGMNPNSTGYSGVAPRIVKEIEPIVGGPDTMHVAYRIVASRAIGRRVGREEANRYWSEKAWAFARSHPLRALTLAGRKVRLLATAYDAYDVPSMALKDGALRAPVWISWAVVVPLAIAGAALMRGRGRLVALYALAAAVAPIAFSVTARQRNPLLLGVTVLAGAAVPALLRLERRRAIGTAILIAVAAAALSLDGDLQREDRFLWTAAFKTDDLMKAAKSNPAFYAVAATWLPESVPPSDPRLVAAVAFRELAGTSSPSRMFSIAVALLDSGAAAPADQILDRLQRLDFQPFRRTRAVSSVAYYRARAFMLLGRGEDARHQLRRARNEAPGDAYVLALSAVVERAPRFGVELNRLHDPCTRDFAFGRAHLAAGDRARARSLFARAAATCPEWTKPRSMR